MKRWILISIIIVFSCQAENKYKDTEQLCELLAQMAEKDQQFRKTTTAYNANAEKQQKLDLDNTKILIEITKERGWPTKNNIGCEEYYSPVAIFRHAPEYYWKEISPLIEKEYQEKRMSEGDYKLILNHLEGRPLDLEIEGVNVILK